MSRVRTSGAFQGVERGAFQSVAANLCQKELLVPGRLTTIAAVLSGVSGVISACSICSVPFPQKCSKH